jgi:hypothetical protein
MKTTQTNFNYTTQLNTFGISAIVLNSYNYEIIQTLKNDGFKYYAKTKEWSKPGFKNLDQFNNYLIALFNNDTKLLQQFKPDKKTTNKQYTAIFTSGVKTQKQKYIESMNEKTIQRLLNENILDRGCIEIMLSYCIKNKLNFWDITTQQIQSYISSNDEILNDIIEYNKAAKIQNCTWLENLYNEGLPF